MLQFFPRISQTTNNQSTEINESSSTAQSDTSSPFNPYSKINNNDVQMSMETDEWKTIMDNHRKYQKLQANKYDEKIRVMTEERFIICLFIDSFH